MTTGQVVAFIVGLMVGSLVTSEIWRRIAWKDFQAAMRDLRAYEKLMKIRLGDEENGLRPGSDRLN